MPLRKTTTTLLHGRHSTNPPNPAINQIHLPKRPHQTPLLRLQQHDPKPHAQPTNLDTPPTHPPRRLHRQSNPLNLLTPNLHFPPRARNPRRPPNIRTPPPRLSLPRSRDSPPQTAEECLVFRAAWHKRGGDGEVRVEAFEGEGSEVFGSGVEGLETCADGEGWRMWDGWFW